MLKTGAWDPEANPPLEEPDSSYFVLDGLLLSRVSVGSRCSGELLAAGDIFRTDHPDTHGYATVASDRSFRVLAPAHIAVLAGGRISELHTLPGFASWFQQRLTEQARSLNLRLAINQVPQLATRLQLLLWHLADRLGRRCPNGALIPFFLSHEVLAECVSAQRTSVLAAMHELEQSGAVERNEEGLYLLHAEPPSEFT
jgi:CRP-like cAMP-binding protein